MAKKTNVEKAIRILRQLEELQVDRDVRGGRVEFPRNIVLRLTICFITNQ